jgi:hypothetical protein
MAAGAHFLSDVIWSALLVFAVSHVLYYHVLRIPQQETSRISTTPRLAWSTLAAVLGAAAVLIALFTGPHGGTMISQTFCVPAPANPVRSFTATARLSNIEVVLLDSQTSSAEAFCSTAAGELHGFGLPTSRLSSGFELDATRTQLFYRVEQRGWLTDVSGELVIRLPATHLQRITVHLGRGNIKIADLTHAGLLRKGRVRLDLRTGSGRCTPATLCVSHADSRTDG